jgi:hypothetical protein
MPKDLPGIGEGAGVAAVRITEVDEAAAKYVMERDKRCRQTPKEVAAKTDLIDVLHKNADKIGRDPEGVLRYEYEDLIVELKPGKETLKVRAVPTDDGDE